MGAQPFDKFLPRALIVPINPILSLSGSTTTTGPTTTSSSTISAPSSSIPASLSKSGSSTASTPSTSSITSSIQSSSTSFTPPPITRTTVVVQSSSSPSPAAGDVAGSNTSFLQNKVASGLVFSIVGIVGAVFVIFLATFFIRRRRNRKLMEDAVSFDPVIVGRDDMEKAEQSSSLGHGSHDVKGPVMYNPSLQYGGYTPGFSPALLPQHQQRHLSYTSGGYSTPV